MNFNFNGREYPFTETELNLTPTDIEALKLNLLSDYHHRHLSSYLASGETIPSFTDRNTDSQPCYKMTFSGYGLKTFLVGIEHLKLSGWELYLEDDNARVYTSHTTSKFTVTMISSEDKKKGDLIKIEELMEKTIQQQRKDYVSTRAEALKKEVAYLEKEQKTILAQKSLEKDIKSKLTSLKEIAI